jgi:site-specific DNA-cytosine methylase
MDAVGFLVGAGSMSVGVERAGFRVAQVWETPPYAVNAFCWDLNRPGTRHKVVELDSASAAIPAGADMVYGNPPCGGVSAMTGSKLDSDTNDQMRHWVRMVARARPRVVLMESGYQLARPLMTRLLADVYNVLDAAGYAARWTWEFYSYQVGTPQNRRRCFVCATLDPPAEPDLIGLGDLEGLGKDNAPSWPWLAPTFGIAPSRHPVTIADGTEVGMHCYNSPRIDRVNEALRGNRWRIAQRYVPPKLMAQLEGMVALNQRSVGAIERARERLWPNCPPVLDFGQEFKRPKVIAPDRAGPTMIGEYIFVHPYEDRMLTMREMASLMGYPLDWAFSKPNPLFVGQGVPVQNASWAAARLAVVAGLS